MNILKALLLTFLLLISCDTDDPSEVAGNPVSRPPDPYSQNILLKKAVNLGNALEAPNEGDWGVVLQENWFDSIKTAGFGAVRIPIRWSAHINVLPPYPIDPHFLSRVDWAVYQALSRDLAVVINVHHFDEMNIDPHGSFSVLNQIWEQLSSHYSGQPNTLMFELFNEPHDAFTADIWNEIIPKLAETVRNNDPLRTLIIGTAEWGGLSALDELSIPADLDNIIVTVHYYSPFTFTHQGAEWAEGSEGWLGTPWPASAADSEELQRNFEFLSDWSEEHGVPVFIGEYGAYSRADMESRVRWTRAVTETARNHGMSTAYWEFCSGFGVYDAQTGQWKQELLDALIF